MSNKLRVVVWDENPPHANKEIYPEGLRTVIADGLSKFDAKGEFEVSTSHLDADDEQGASVELLESADVLLWWGHARHGEVRDEIAARVKDRVHNHGLGFVCLHSGHYAKTFREVLGATGHLKGGWREANDTEEIRVCAPWHPIAEGVEDFTLSEEEMYGAPFDVPPAQVQVFQSYFPLGGETFPSGLCWTVGEGVDPEFTSGGGKGQNQGFGVGRVFYFRPGHEAYATYHDERIQRVIYNGVRWAGKITG